MATRTKPFTAIRHLFLSFVLLVGVAANVQAATLTVFFSGTIDLSGMGAPANSTYSGSITWDPAKVPFESHPPNDALYFAESSQLILNGVNKPKGAGLFVGNNSDLNGGPGSNDVLGFFLPLDSNVTINGVTGDTLLVLGFLGNQNAWNTTSLPSDFSFLSLLPTRFSIVSLEVTGEGEDVVVGEGGSFVATPAPVPEPATLTLTALGLAGVVTRARRNRQRPNQ